MGRGVILLANTAPVAGKTARRDELKADYAKARSIIVLLPFLLNLVASGRGYQSPEIGTISQPFQTIHLSDLGYRPAERWRGKDVPSDLTLLYDDPITRLTFINDETLVVYLSHHQPPSQMGSADSQNMEAFFLNTGSGSLISRATWATRKRRWLNDRWDTQGRILAVHGGFLVHAGNALLLYSEDEKKKVELALDPAELWAAVVAPMGRTIHVQRIDGSNAEGEWLASDTLTKLQSQHEVPGITSASDHAVVTKLAHCIQLQAVGEPPRGLCCSDPCRLGLPEFLNDTEVLSVEPNGFEVLSREGQVLWSRETAGAGNRIMAAHKRALEGNRFAVSISGGHHTVFDQVSVPNEQFAILVYDRLRRAQVFRLGLTSSGPGDFDLSPDGSMLAVLVGDTVQLYKIPL